MVKLMRWFLSAVEDFDMCHKYTTNYVKKQALLCAQFFVSFRPVWNNPVELKVRDCVQGVETQSYRKAFCFSLHNLSVFAWMLL